MSAAELYTFIGIAVGMLTLMVAFVNAIYKIANVISTMEALSEAVTLLATRVNTLDQRMYDALRSSPKR